MYRVAGLARIAPRRVGFGAINRDAGILFLLGGREAEASTRWAALRGSAARDALNASRSLSTTTVPSRVVIGYREYATQSDKETEAPAAQPDDTAAAEPTEPSPPTPSARYPWRFSFEPPFPPTPTSFFGKVMATVKQKHFLNLGLQRAKRHLPTDIGQSFPDSLLASAPTTIGALFAAMADPECPEDVFRMVASPILANRLIQAASEAEQLGLDVQFAHPDTLPTSVQVIGYRFVYGPRDNFSGSIPETHKRTPWFDGLVTFITPKEEAKFRHHQQQREQVLAAMKEGGHIFVDVQVEWPVKMRVLEESTAGGEGQVVVEDEKKTFVVTFESPRFIGGAKGEQAQLVDSEIWDWKVADVDYILAQELEEIGGVSE